MLTERKLREYYNLKKTIDFASVKLAKLNKELKEELEPGTHTVGQYEYDLQLKTKYEYNYMHLPDDIFWTCLIEVVDPQLVESAYLRGDLTDEQIEEIRGEVKIIPSLKVDRIEKSVQENL